MLNDRFDVATFAGWDEAEMPFRQRQARDLRDRAEAWSAPHMPRQRGCEQAAMPLSRDTIENDAGERHLRIVPRKAADPRRRRCALPPRIDHQHDRPPRHFRQFRRGARLAIGAGAVEQPHDAFAQHELGIALQRGDKPGERRATHRPHVEIDAGPAARGGVKARIDIVGPGLCSADPHAAAPQTSQQAGSDQCLAASGSRRGEDQPASRRHAGSPIQSSVARNRTISPTAIIVGPSMPPSAPAGAASASDVTSTRCAGVVALLTIATGSSARRPAAMSRAAIAPRWRNPIYSTMTGEPRAIASQSIPFGAAPPLLWPVTKVTAELMSRWVTGMPA